MANKAITGGGSVPKIKFIQGKGGENRRKEEMGQKKGRKGRNKGIKHPSKNKILVMAWQLTVFNITS